MSIDSPALHAATYLDGTGVQQTDDDLAALTRVLLGVEVERPESVEQAEVDDETQERRRAQQRRQRLLAELSFLDE